MNFQLKKIWKLVLLLFAVNIAILSLLYTHKLVGNMKQEEQRKVDLWITAMQGLVDVENDEDPGFYFDVIKANKTIPIILADQSDSVLFYANLDSSNIINDSSYLLRQLEEMKLENVPIEVDLGRGQKNYVYYKNSILLKQLKYYPYFQIGIISLFILVSYLAFNASRKSEQNRIWVGLAKETAHQLGTPISSLMAWVEVFRTLEEKPDPYMMVEMEKDVNRLELVTERFSKIGSVPVLVDEDIKKLVENTVSYMRTRASGKVEIFIVAEELHSCFAMVNRQLFDWVLENLVKNAIDAMEGKGRIVFTLSETKKKVFLDISDTGKGIPGSDFKSVFKPGFTTKKRGWGLGLSLARRIIREYHKGEIFVKESAVGKGTTFRIVLRKH